MPTRRAATKAALPAGESPAPIVARFDREADLTREEVTSFVQAQVTKSSLPQWHSRWMWERLGGRANLRAVTLRNVCSPEKLSPREVVCGGIWRAPSPLGKGEGRRRCGRNGYVHATGTRGKGHGTQGRWGSQRWEGPVDQQWVVQTAKTPHIKEYQVEERPQERRMGP